jgi:HSP20 family molecular chaperone IbpA
MNGQEQMTTREETRAPERVEQRPWVAPRVDVFENKDELVLVVDLPGVTQDALKIHLEAERLDIEARPEPPRPATALLRETRRFDYRRSFVLPGWVDREKAAAQLKDGVLTLRLPKVAAVKPRRIEVKAG